MGCSFDKDIIQKYVDNTIDPLELIVLKEHINVCQDCKFELELMNKLEDSIHGYFSSMPDNKLLDAFSDNVLNKCYVEADLKSSSNRMLMVWKINKKVFRTALICTSYIPGRKLAVNAAKKTYKGINKHIKNYAANRLKMLIANAAK